jgi:hypothetical protein
MSDLSHFDHSPTEAEVASEQRSPSPRPKSARDARADVAAAWTRHVDARLKINERQTMRALASAVAVVLREERDEQRKTIDELADRVAVVERELAALKGMKPFKVVDKGAA